MRDDQQTLDNLERRLLQPAHRMDASAFATSLNASQQVRACVRACVRLCLSIWVLGCFGGLDPEEILCELNVCVRVACCVRACVCARVCVRACVRLRACVLMWCALVYVAAGDDACEHAFMHVRVGGDGGDGL